MNAWSPKGTVYGTLLNFRREWDLWAPRMTQDPHKAPPKAPVLYVKSANTFAPAGQDLLLQDSVQEVDIGATLGLVIGAHAQLVGAALLLDWNVPHSSYYRPPVKFRCRDGFLGLPAQPSACAPDARWDDVRIEGEFMTLQPGDVLMVGTDCLPDGTRPRARVGDTVELSAPGLLPVRTHVKGLA